MGVCGCGGGGGCGQGWAGVGRSAMPPVAVCKGLAGNDSRPAAPRPLIPYPHPYDCDIPHATVQGLEFVHLQLGGDASRRPVGPTGAPVRRHWACLPKGRHPPYSAAYLTTTPPPVSCSASVCNMVDGPSVWTCLRRDDSGLLRLCGPAPPTPQVLECAGQRAEWAPAGWIVAAHATVVRACAHPSSAHAHPTPL